MKLTTTFRVLYYGITASITGGFVFPLQETKNWKYVAVFHIYTFLMFFIPPLGLFYVSLTHYYTVHTACQQNAHFSGSVDGRVCAEICNESWYPAI